MPDGKLNILQRYVSQGWKLVPIPKGSKAPTGLQAKGWQTNYITDVNAIGEGNVGILLGEPSGWLIDIDLDWPEAASLAPEFLPPTPAIFGRQNNPDSHWLYQVQGAKTRKWQLGKKNEGGMVVELRSTGHQTVFPPSVHPSGDVVKWSSDNPTPAPVDFKELSRACGRLAAAALAMRNWEDGSRQDLSFAISGLLLKSEWEVKEVQHFLQVVSFAVGDDEIEKRIITPVRTAAKIEHGEDVSGFSALAEIWGEDVAKAFSKWTGADKEAMIPDGAIYITHRASRDITGEAWGKISEDQLTAPELFSFGEEIARVDRNVKVLSREGLWQEMAHRLSWAKASGQKVHFCDPPVNVITYMREQRKSDIPLPHLTGVTSAPVMMTDGNFHTAPGYNSISQLYHFPTVKVPEISQIVTKDELQHALGIINEIYCDFPFVHDSDKAHAISMLILPFFRPLIEGNTPLHLLDKPKQGTGATLMAEICTIVKMGEAIAAKSAPRNEEEWEKIITAKLMSAPEFFFFDNVRAIYSDTLAMALTGSKYEGRKLGASEILTLPVNCTWLMTGNNVEMGADFPRRIVHIRIDANMEDPAKRREFKHPNLKEWIREERGRIVWAILTLGRWWYQEGKPNPDNYLPSFESWSSVIGGILKAAGIKGFLTTPEDRKGGIDPYADSENEFVRCWLAHKIKDDSFSTVRSGQLLSMAEGCELDYAKGRDMNSIAFGKSRMPKLNGRVFEIHSLGEEEQIIKVKVKRTTVRGNGAWGIEVMGKPLDLIHDDVWSGIMWGS